MIAALYLPPMTQDEVHTALLRSGYWLELMETMGTDHGVVVHKIGTDHNTYGFAVWDYYASRNFAALVEAQKQNRRGYADIFLGELIDTFYWGDPEELYETLKYREKDHNYQNLSPFYQKARTFFKSKIRPDRRQLWLIWTAHMLKSLRKGDLVSVAHHLACCTDGDDPLDDWGHRLMFSSYELRKLHQQLWSLIRHQITPESQPEVISDLRSWGWTVVDDRKDPAYYVTDYGTTTHRIAVAQTILRLYTEDGGMSHELLTLCSKALRIAYDVDEEILVWWDNTSGQFKMTKRSELHKSDYTEKNYYLSAFPDGHIWP